MHLRSIIHATLALAAVGLIDAQTEPALAQVPADEGFVVGDIRIEGLQRISEGTVYNYLPVNIGDRLDSRRIGEALRALFATGFFRDVELRREGGTLVVAVLERPSIESFEIKGNKDIKTEDLQRSLRNVGLAPGKTFDQSTLDEVRQYLTDQYFARGKYGVRVDTHVEEVPGNKVKVTIDIKEGKRARIRQINIAGNTAFDDEELLEQFELKTPNWLSWYRQDDRYSREALSGDLEKLRSYYMDRGYANFAVTSTQVAIAPEKDDIFITINVDEGDVYKIADVKLAGNMVVPEAQLRQFIMVKPGETYSLRKITASSDAMKLRLGLSGYAFATIDPVPQVNEETKEITITFVIDPKNRVYVRRINFNGTSGVNDEVFRREMRQLEGAYLSNAAVDRSKERIQRLPFIESVEVETNPVPGTPDLVDVDFQIKEGLPGQFGGGIGYSEAQSVILSGNFVHSNFMGTGNRVAAQINSGRYSKYYTFAHTDPYTTIDGVQRTVSVGYRDITQLTSATSDFDTETISASLNYDFPLTEYQYFGVGISAQRAELLGTEGGSADQVLDWLRVNGDTRVRCFEIIPDGVCTVPLEREIVSSSFNIYELYLGWRYDSRNRALFADRGMRHRFNLGYTLPGSDVEFWNATYDYLQFVPLWRGFTLMFNVELAYARALGETTAIPPYRQFFAGGPDSVRGFRESRLGPKDNFGRPYGGNIKTVAQMELLLPMPDKWRNSARFSLFYDIGNVFNDQDIKFYGPPGLGTAPVPVDYNFSYDELKQSVGIAVQWLAPLGVFRFSYAIPLNADKQDRPDHWGDETEGFQFSIGQAF
ncbi:MAG: outer membrane protein assembly factor BamA [Gammaproteobacteria bacterium]|nr:outer membrane protein assembly factor BamA [Gammaproteobacteria bacterium]